MSSGDWLILFLMAIAAAALFYVFWLCEVRRSFKRWEALRKEHKAEIQCWRTENDGLRERLDTAWEDSADFVERWAEHIGTLGAPEIERSWKGIAARIRAGKEPPTTDQH